MPAVTFKDETATGRWLAEFHVADLPTRMTVRELIRLRVREEVARHNAAPVGTFNGLVRPVEAEIELNGYRLDWERQAAIAERAFSSNGFFVLAGDRQVEDLDEEIDLAGNPELVFVKLVPLAGG